MIALFEAHQPKPNLRDLFYDLLVENLDEAWQNDLPICIIMESFDTALKEVERSQTS